LSFPPFAEQVSLSVSVSEQNFYLVKDAFLSNLALVLGINPRRISVVDVVAGRRRRFRSLFQLGGSAGTSISLEIVPDPVIGFDPTVITVLDNVGTVNVTVTRSVNVVGNCSAEYWVYVDETTTALASADFSAAAGSVLFLSGQTTATISVSVFSSGYRPVPGTFWVGLRSATNASLGSAFALVTLIGVYPPPPPAPQAVDGAASVSTVRIQWRASEWPSAPTQDLAIALAWNLRCNWSNRELNLSGAFPDQIITAAAALAAVSITESSSSLGVYTVNGLVAHTAVQCQVRMQTSQGWGGWSPNSPFVWSLAVCGDGIRQGTEQCDDGNTTNGDGCSLNCTVELAWSCSRNGPAAADRCTQGCGNGTVEGSEQ
jgi:cysteine-rich repeat protein